MSENMEHLLKKLKTKKQGSIEFKKIEKRIVKEMKKQQRYRESRAREYSLSLSKIFGNKLLNFI